MIRLPPARVLFGLLVTFALVYGFTVGISVWLEVPVHSPQSVIWRVTVCMALMYVEWDRRRLSLLMVNLGVGRAGALSLLFGVWLVLEAGLRASGAFS